MTAVEDPNPTRRTRFVRGYLKTVCEDDVWIHGGDVKVVDKRLLFPLRIVAKHLELLHYRRFDLVVVGNWGEGGARECMGGRRDGEGGCGWCWG